MIKRNVHNKYSSNVNIHIKLIWLPVVFVLFLVNTRKLFLFVAAMYYIARYISFLIRLKHNQHVQLNTGKLVLRSRIRWSVFINRNHLVTKEAPQNCCFLSRSRNQSESSQ